MRRFLLTLPLAVVAVVGCSDTPTVATNAETIAQQAAEEKKATGEEEGMRGKTPDPAKKPKK